MKDFFYPKTIAVIGASRYKGKIGYALMKNLLRFNGRVFPINIKAKKVLGKKCYKSVLDVKEGIDLAVIAIPAKAVASVLEECGKKEIKSVIIISAGFSEIGNLKLEAELEKIRKKYKMRILGPNAFGVVNPYLNLDTSFSRVTPEKGDIAFISQSGALWAAISELSLGKFGFSKFASLGNMLDLNFSDLIDYFNQDKETKSIVLYIETLKNGKSFMNSCKNSKKPIIVIKAGKSIVGKEAALSHTGSLAGEYEIYNAAFKQCKIIEEETLTGAFDKALFLSKQKIGKKVVIMSNAGGPAVLTADFCSKNNLDVIKLPINFIKKLKLPVIWSRANPIDMTGSSTSKDYKNVLIRLSKENFYDSAIIIVLPLRTVDLGKVAKYVVDFKKKSKKNVVACFMARETDRKKAEKILKKSGIPCFYELEKAASVLK